MSRKKRLDICPINTDGCKYDNGEAIQVCMFWRVHLGCELESLIHDLRTIPNLLRRLEKQLEEGKHL